MVITSLASNGHHYFDLYVTENSTSVSNNTSTVGFSFVLRSATGGSGYDWTGYVYPNKPVNYTILINGTNYSGTIYSYDGHSEVTVYSNTQTVTHNANGAKTIAVSFSVASLSAAYLPGSASASGNLQLTTLQRSPSVSQSLSSKTETSLTIKWSSDTVIDKVESSINNGSSWTTKATNANAKSGTLTITGLTANTTYSQVKVRLRSKASQISGTSSASSYSTYDYPNPNSTPNFTIGSSVKIGVFNPLGRSVTVNLIADGTTVATGTTSSISITLTPDASVLYGKILSSASGTYTASVVYGSSTKTKNGTYTIPSSAVPSFTAFTYEDTYQRAISITGDNQKIIQNKSRVKFAVTGLAGYEGSSVTSASVMVMGTSYPLTIDGTSAEVTMVNVNSPTDVSATLTVTDSRGAKATGSVTLTMLEYAEPYANITAVRKNNYYSETDLTVNATISPLNNQNTLAIAYQYKRSDGDYGNWATIQDGVTTTVTLDNHYAWVIRVRLTDRLTNVYTEVNVLVGIPILFIDRRLNAVGFNCFPSESNEILANGHDLRNHVVTASLTSTISSPSVQTYSQISFDTSVEFGDKLTLEYGSVKIGSGVSKVKVSASLSIHAGSVSSVRSFRICKNSFSDANTVGWVWESVNPSEYVQLVLHPVLIDVQENDEIGMYYYVQSGDEIAGTFGGRTSLTVEYVG